MLLKEVISANMADGLKISGMMISANMADVVGKYNFTSTYLQLVLVLVPVQH